MLSFWSNLSLRFRIPLLVTCGLLIILAPFVYLSGDAIRKSQDSALQERLILAKMAAQHMDQTLNHAVQMLESTASLPGVFQQENNLQSEQETLLGAYRQLGIFSYGLFLLDTKGDLLVAEPSSIEQELRSRLPGWSQTSQTLTSGKTVISGIDSGIATTPMACITTPVRDSKGNIIGVLGGAIDFRSPGLAGLLDPIQLGETGRAQIVDQAGVVLDVTSAGGEAGSTDHQARFAQLITEQQATVKACHNCHEPSASPPAEKDIIAFAPLSTASWGVVIREPEAQAFAAANELQNELVLLGSLSLLGGATVAFLLTKRVVAPLSLLSKATQSIAAGELDRPVQIKSRGEIGQLGQSFELMRNRLKASMAEVQEWNQELENRVAERTAEIEESQRSMKLLYEEVQHKERALSSLLEKVIGAQEEERRRIARGLHDETSQFLAALTINLEALAQSCKGSNDDARRKLENLKSQVVDTLENVHNLIVDLRSDYLEDLGLAGAVQWYAENRLSVLGIDFEFRIEGEERQLPGTMETALFRITQEAVTNIVKHAEADSALIRLEFGKDMVAAEISDDGRGFDAARVGHSGSPRPSFGLVGIRERVDILGGTLSIESSPGSGTRIRVEIPCGKE